MHEPLSTTVVPSELSPTNGFAALLPQDRKYCQTCATVLDVRAELCPKCGIRQNGALTAAVPAAPLIQQHVIITNQVSAQASAPPTKSNVLAFILGLFLGPVGLWYKGHWAAGFVWFAALVILGGATGGTAAPAIWLFQAIHAAVAKPL